MAFVQIAVIDGLRSTAAELDQFKHSRLGVALFGGGNETQPADYWQERGAVFFLCKEINNQGPEREVTKSCSLSDVIEPLRANHLLVHSFMRN